MFPQTANICLVLLYFKINVSFPTIMYVLENLKTFREVRTSTMALGEKNELILSSSISIFELTNTRKLEPTLKCRKKIYESVFPVLSRLWSFSKMLSLHVLFFCDWTWHGLLQNQKFVHFNTSFCLLLFCKIRPHLYL